MAKSITLFKEKNKQENRNTLVKDRPLKSIIKAITWRIVGSIDTFLLSFFIIKFIDPQATHSAAKTAGSIASVEVVSKILLYYLHERAWEQLRWGRMMVIIRRNRKSITRMILNQKT